ncbi:hypothetical protein H0H92_002460 [Tricholoma furcatifolium]|nr:hypothetical protein H0H92_002460 [Tricholoma furcatifolium]
MASPSASHLLLVPVPVWSHIKPLCALAVRIVTQSQNAIVTILTTSTLYEKCDLDISSHFDESRRSIRQRIRLLSIADSTAPNVTATLELIARNYPATYEALVQGKPTTCLTTGVVFDAAPPLSAVIMDLKATYAATGDSIPIIAWLLTGVAAFLRNFAPESMGGIGDKTEEIKAEATRSGRSVWEVGQEFYGQTNGTIVNVPGIPTMYDYELHPQKLHSVRYFAPIIESGRELLKVCSALIIGSHEAYGKETMGALKSWQSDQGKPVYLVGPLVFEPPKCLPQSDAAKSNSDVTTFLDTMLEQHGTASVLSFGTIYWPTVPEYMDEMIEALIEKKFPFILTHAGPHAQIKPELAERIKASGIGFLAQWAPQEFVLNHPATGWFVSHCGHGSVTETLYNGIPLISWPFTGDQPQAAAQVADNLKTGFELFEVRTGLGLGPSYRTGKAPKGTREAVGDEIRRVLDACRSEEGAEIRRNAAKLKEEFRSAWDENGAATIAMQAFLQKYAKA